MNIKEQVRNDIMLQMRYHINSGEMEILGAVLTNVLAKVEVEQSQTELATVDNTNDYILELFKMQKAPKLSSKTANYYLDTIKRLADYSGKVLTRMSSMDIEAFLNSLRKTNTEVSLNNQRWCDDRQFTREDTPDRYFYKASEEDGFTAKWHPSIHMPKEAARIWLKVTDVRVERLQDIDEDGVWDEGFTFKPPCLTRVSADGHTCELDGPCTSHIKYCDMTMGELFGRELWNSTIKKSDLDRYGWNANPYVWVIEFERCEKPEGV